MSGRGMAAIVVAALVLTGGVVVPLSLADDGDGTGHHQKHKHHKKKKHKHRPKPVASPTPTSTPAGQGATADVTSGPFHVTFTARRTEGLASKSATGTFRGELDGGAFFAGPVTCMSVVGDDVGLFYPITDAAPPMVANANTGVYVTLQTDGKGNATKLGFVLVPSAITDECDPGVAELPAEGPATVYGG